MFSAKHGKGFEYVPPEAKPDVNANGPICPVCHAQNPPDTLFCERCGQPMRGGVPPQACLLYTSGWFSLIFVRIVLFLYGKFERHLGAKVSKIVLI